MGKGHRITVAADKAYDTADFVAEMRRIGATPHVAQNNKRRRSAIDWRTTRGLQAQRAGAQSDSGGVRLGEGTGGQSKTLYRGTARVALALTFAAAAYNLIRMPKLLTRVA